MSSSSTTNTSTATTTTDNKKPTIPANYQVPTVWTYDEATMKPIHGSNLPTAGARSTAPRMVGKHAIQLYGLATPNGMKASIMLEELNEALGVEYDAYTINIGQGDQFASGFVEINPNSKIPALFDQSNGARVFESGAILVYLAEKYQAFLPLDNPVLKAECLSWVFFQTGAGPYYGGGGFSHFFRSAPLQWQYAIDRYTIETKRILDVLNQHLATRLYLCGDEYTIADMMHWNWTKRLLAEEFLDGSSYPNLIAWVDRIGARPAVQRGGRVLGFGPDALKERHSAADFH